ncbi:MAG TPA: PIG-L family deacetylase [Bacteroidia bacterium]|nr:PIG-L family deacetylase [Bacteroidia bacterium]
MKKVILTFVGIISLQFLSCSQKPTIAELQKFAAVEKYPNDNYLDTVSHKKAIVVVAHDDDDCAMSGTLAKLKADGWEIKQLCFVVHHKNSELNSNPNYKEEELIVADGVYRLGLDTIKYPYVPITREEMEKQYLREKITTELISKINSYSPDVIFTLDNEMGGYGHPDHIYCSQLVLDLFNSKKINVNRIYQSVYTNHMEKEIVDIWLYNKMKKYNFPNPTRLARELYKIDGMPEPNVQINITNYAETKMSYLLSFEEEARKSLRKFIPYFEEFDAKTYFTVFDREFFRIIK